MLRITEVRAASGQVHVLLEGDLTGPWVAELWTTVRAILDSGGHPLNIDVSGVRFVDAEGIALLHQLIGQGLNLSGASAFVAAMLNSGR